MNLLFSRDEDTAHNRPLQSPSGAQQQFISFEEGEFRQQLKELDSQLTQALPVNHRSDITYKSSQTPVRYIFELPVPVESAGAHVSYRFATDEYDISFGVFFQGLDGKVETVLASARVDSHYEPISGDITVHRPGTVILLFDNTYSWFATKNLSYSVALRYPSGQAADNERIQNARKVVDAAYHDIAEADVKLVKVSETKEKLTAEVARIESEIELLQAELEENRKELNTSVEDAELLEQTVLTRRTHVVPLLLRALPMRAFLQLAGYVGTENKDIYTINKFWARLLTIEENASSKQHRIVMQDAAPNSVPLEAMEMKMGGARIDETESMQAIAAEEEEEHAE